MGFNLFDVLVVAYVAYGAWKGWRRGLGRELSALLAVALFVLTGWGMAHWIRGAVETVGHYTGQSIHGVSLIVLLVGSFILAGKVRGRVRRWVETRWPVERWQKR